MRHDFEATTNKLIEVYHYNSAHKFPSRPGRKANISGIEFSGGRGPSGVDILWHHPKEFKKLSKDQRYQLVYWVHSNDDKKVMTDSGKATQNNKNKG